MVRNFYSLPKWETHLGEHLGTWAVVPHLVLYSWTSGLLLYLAPCMCVCSCKCACMSIARGQLPVLLIRSCSPCFLRQALTGVWALLTVLGWQASELPQHRAYECAPSYFTWTLRVGFGSLYLPGKHRTHWGNSPALLPATFWPCSVSRLLSVVHLFSKELESFRLCGCAVGKLSWVSFTWKCLCLIALVFGKCYLCMHSLC